MKSECPRGISYEILDKIKTHVPILQEVYNNVQTAYIDVSNCGSYFCEMRGNIHLIRTGMRLANRSIFTILEITKTYISCIGNTVGKILDEVDVEIDVVD